MELISRASIELSDKEAVAVGQRGNISLTHKAGHSIRQDHRSKFVSN
jgi:hypothetical protein